MLHKAWNSIGEMPYCFPRSSIKFQGHTVQNITDFDPNWAFPDYRPVAAFKSLRFALLSDIYIPTKPNTYFLCQWWAYNDCFQLCIKVGVMLLLPLSCYCYWFSSVSCLESLHVHFTHFANCGVMLYPELPACHTAGGNGACADHRGVIYNCRQLTAQWLNSGAIC